MIRKVILFGIIFSALGFSSTLYYNLLKTKKVDNKNILEINGNKYRQILVREK